jgi:tetratricopeptide (TPR) repeat protein
VLISAATSQLVQGYVQLEALPPLQLKGITTPVTAFRVVGLGRRRSPIALRGERSLSQFVGRTRELATLEALLTRVEAGEGQVVGVVGEAGAGKSRLLFEFRQCLRDRSVTYLEGRCLSYGRAIPYVPLLDLLRHNCGITDTETPETLTAKVCTSLEEVGMDAAEWAPYLLHLFGVQAGTERLGVLSPEAIKARTFELIRQMSLNGSQRRPLIFEIEDLHWMDTTSEAFFALLAENLNAARILVLGTYRPGYRPPWLEQSNATQIALQRLTSADGLAVIRSLAPPERLSESMAQTILAKAEGNPFFLEELTRTVLDVGESQAALIVPDTVQGVLMARIDRLPEVAKRLLQTASVLGRAFSFRLLSAIWAEPGGLAPLLLELKRLEFVYEQTGAEEPTYVFKHALTQDVAYESLLMSRRQALHAAAGEALEAPLCRTARGCLRAHSFYFLGRMKDTLDLLLQYQTQVDQLQEPALAGPYYFWLGHTYSYLGDQERAAQSAQRALEEGQRCGDDATMGRAYYLLARRGFLLCQYPQGVEHGLQAITLLKRVQEGLWLGQAYWAVGINYFFMGDFERALEAESRAYALGEVQGNPRLQTYTGWSSGWMLATRGDWEAGIAACQRSLECSRDTVNTAAATGWLGFSYLEKGDLAQAMPRLEQAIQQFRQIGYWPLLSWFNAWLSEALRLSGDIEPARHAAIRAIEIGHEAKNLYGVAYAQRVLGQIAQDGGALSEAHVRLSEALDIFTLIQSRFEVGRTHLALAALAHLQGNAAAVTTHLGAAHALCTALQAPVYVERTENLARAYGITLPPGSSERELPPELPR